MFTLVSEKTKDEIYLSHFNIYIYKLSIAFYVKTVIKYYTAYIIHTCMYCTSYLYL